jgi:site-specific DNA recombinase
MTPRAITYARVSGDDRGNDGRNLAGQLEMCREYVQEKGYTLLAEMAEDDRGASGASFELEKLGEILDMAKNHEFDVLVVREIDRLSRNLAKQLVVEEELNRSDIRIEYVLGEYADSPEGNLMKHVRAVVAEYEREKIKERIQRGKRLKVKAGSVMLPLDRPPFGYKIVKEGNRCQLEICESEAKIIRMLYDWYVHGDENGKTMTLRGIAQRLTESMVLTPLDIKKMHGISAGIKKRPLYEWSGSVIRPLAKVSLS